MTPKPKLSLSKPIMDCTPQPPCACGNPRAYWDGPKDGQRVYACAGCHKPAPPHPYVSASIKAGESGLTVWK